MVFLKSCRPSWIETLHPQPDAEFCRMASSMQLTVVYTVGGFLKYVLYCLLKIWCVIHISDIVVFVFLMQYYSCVSFINCHVWKCNFVLTTFILKFF